MDPLALQALDIIGIAVFAMTGALAASRKELDLIGFAFLAAITGVGGGTLRDVLLGQTPVFWIREPLPIVLCGGVALAVYFLAPFIEYRYRLLLWADAVGISGYCVVGAARALAVGVSPVGAVVMGVVTCCVGGILRDLIVGEPSVLLRREIYITATLAGAVLFVGAIELGLPFWPAAFAGTLLAFGVRAGALAFGWSLPTYRSRPGRDISQ